MKRLHLLYHVLALFHFEIVIETVGGWNTESVRHNLSDVVGEQLWIFHLLLVRLVHRHKLDRKVDIELGEAHPPHGRAVVPAPHRRPELGVRQLHQAERDVTQGRRCRAAGVAGEIVTDGLMEPKTLRMP